MPSITFEGKVPVPHEELLQHIEHSRGLGLPYIRDVEPHGRKLAVVGGGPSIVGMLDEIRRYADVWAINGTAPFLEERGIACTLLSVDPCDFLAPRVVGAKRAILASRCHPKVFEVLKGAEIQIFDAVQDCIPNGYGVWASVSTMGAVPHLATVFGFRETVFYGCEGSFDAGTHAYMDEKDLQEFKFVVLCGGREYTTAPDLYQQCLAMLPFFRTFPKHFSERSGGLLRAIVENDGEHEIVKVSKKLLAGLTPINEESARVQRESLERMAA